MKRYLLTFVCVGCFGAKAFAESRGDVVIDDTHVFPESITSRADGTLIIGSIKGIIFRAGPGEARAIAWIRPTVENGLLAVFGVLVDEPSRSLWVCSVPNPFQRSAERPPSSLLMFDINTGQRKGAYPFPEGGVCNDIAVGPDGTVYATDTPGGRLLALKRSESALRVVAQDERLKGIDGLAFSGEGRLYVNLVSTGALLRLDLGEDGRVSKLTELKLSQPLAGPDGFRLIEKNRFLLAEGPGGRVDEVTINGDTATIRVLREGLNSSPGVTLAGNAAYAIEGKIGYLIDPKLKGKDPGQFKAYAIPLK
jgi:sugar lactone lactonase YvrE